jgi:hypothetical protein
MVAEVGFDSLDLGLGEMQHENLREWSVASGSRYRANCFSSNEFWQKIIAAAHTP